jgi:hypothetical protein
MVLIKSIEDWTMPVLGFAHETFMCPGCGATDQRTAFHKEIKEKHEAEIAAILAKQPTALPDRSNDQAPTRGFIRGVLAKIRGHWGRSLEDK